jgi:hypothetical protein
LTLAKVQVNLSCQRPLLTVRYKVHLIEKDVG